MYSTSRFILTLAALTLLVVPAAQADVPTNMNVQGRLLDSAGAAANPGLYIFTFRIFDQEAGGTRIWPASPGENQTLLVNDRGLWSASVGELVALTEAVFQDTSRWLEVTVNNGINPAETLPRMKLKTSPFTYRSASSQSAENADLLDGLNSTDFAPAAHGHAGLWNTLGPDYYYSAGNVGVGTSSPTAKLEVAGGAIVNRSNLLTDHAPVTAQNLNGGTTGGFGTGHWGVIGEAAGTTANFRIGTAGIAHGSPAGGTAWGLYGGLLDNNGTGATYAVFGTNQASGTGPAYSGYFEGGDFAITLVRTPGSQGVQLPNDAIQASEILDEPGIASQRTSAAVDFTSVSAITLIDLETVTIQIPTSGYIDLRASVYVWVGGAAGTAGLIDLQIDETAGGSVADPHRRVAGTLVKATASNEFHMVPLDRVYFKSAGTYTFRLEGGRNSITAGTTVHVFNRSLTAVFYPTSYGSVAATVQSGETGEFDEVTSISIDPADAGLASGTDAVQTVYQVDLRELELKAARAEAAAERARRELLEAQAQSGQSPILNPAGSSAQGDR